MTTCYRAICIASAFLSLCSASDANELALSTAQVRAELEEVLETLSNRQLTDQELDTVTAEYIPLFQESGCQQKCVENVRWNAARIAYLKDHRGRPGELRMRHEYISNLHFSSMQSGSLIQRIIAEPDPVLVIEPSPQRVMTKSDVIASMNLYHFAQQRGEPKARRFSEKDIQAAATSLNEIYGSKAHVMPTHLTLAAAYWRGLEQSWSKFTAEQRKVVRAYFSSSAVPEAVCREFGVCRTNPMKFQVL